MPHVEVKQVILIDRRTNVPTFSPPTNNRYESRSSRRRIFTFFKRRWRFGLAVVLNRIKDVDEAKADRPTNQKRKSSKLPSHVSITPMKTYMHPPTYKQRVAVTNESLRSPSKSLHTRVQNTRIHLLEYARLLHNILQTDRQTQRPYTNLETDEPTVFI